MGKQFDFDKPAFKPMAAPAGASHPVARSASKQHVSNSLNASKKRDLVKTPHRYSSRRSHEQRISTEDIASAPKSQSKSQFKPQVRPKSSLTGSPYDYLERGVQAPDKTTHINTAYQFVLNASFSDNALLNDPNASVPMDFVLSVICQPMSCPICLEEVPEAPRMLECGHLMCLPCLLRYLDSSEGTQEQLQGTAKSFGVQLKKCPLCSDIIHANKVKPASFRHIIDEFDTPKEDHDVVLRLMFRPLGSLLAIPVSDVTDINADYFSKDFVPIDDSDTCQFSRIVRGSADSAIAQHVKEIQGLIESKKNAAALYQDQSEDVTYWYNEAIKNIKKDIQELKELNAKEHEHGLTLNSLNLNPNEHNEQEERPTKHLNLASYQNGEAFYFYQTAFGLPTKYFLTPLDIKILKAAYKDFSKLPPFLIAPVLNAESGWYVNDDLIKRIKYLGHIPRYTPISLIECDWTNIVSEDVLKQFAPEIKARKNRKDTKNRKETRDKLRYDKLAETKLLKDTGFEVPYVVNRSEEDIDFKNPELAPPLPSLQSSQSGGNPSSRTGKTVWGTQAIAFSPEDKDVDFETEPEEPYVDYAQMISDAKQMPKGKGRKKLVLLSTRSNREAVSR